MRYKSTQAVVFNCMNIMALPIIRSLGIKNIHLSGVFGKSSEYHIYSNIIRHSKYLKNKIYFDETNYEKSLVDALVSFGKKQNSKPVIFLASDRDMITTSKHREILNKYYLFTLPEHELLDQILNKEKFIDLAREKNLPIPKSRILFSGKELSNALEDFEYPYIIKPSWRDDNWLRRFHEQKVLLIRSGKDISDQIEILKSMNTRYVLQEIVPGTEKNILCTFAVLNEKSEPIEIGHCRKIHQYPPNFGNTALAEPIHDKELENLSLRIFKDLGLVGYASIEYKRDTRDNKLKIMEITPNRFNRQFAVTNLIGLNLAWALFNFELGLEHKKPEIIISSKMWISEVNEIRAFRHYQSLKEYSIIGWLAGLINGGWYEIFSLQDPRPFLTFLKKPFKVPLVKIYHSFKKLLRIEADN